MNAVTEHSSLTPVNGMVESFLESSLGRPVHERLAAYLYENTDSFAEIATFAAIEGIFFNLDTRYLDIKKNMQNTLNIEKYFAKYLELCNTKNGEIEYRKLPQENLATKDIRRIVYDRKNDMVLGLVCTSVIDEVQFVVKGIAIEDYALKFEAVCTEEFEATTREINSINGFDQSGNFVKRSNVVQLADLQLAHDSFYPYMSTPMKELIAGFLNSRSNIMIFFGEPGTGKSTLSKYIVSQMAIKDDVSTIDNNALFESPHFAGAMANDNDTKLYIMEDSDVLLGKRSEGNRFMSTLLNQADGIVPSKTKYIFTTNLEHLNDLDSAILRPGRLYSAVKFRKITQTQANQARADAGMEPLDVFTTTGGEEATGDVTLSEALAQPRIDMGDGSLPKQNSTQKPKMGFA